MRKIAMILAVVVVAGSIYAAGDDMAVRKQEAEKLLVIMNVPKAMETALNYVSRMQAAQMQRMKMTTDQMKKSQMIQKETMDLIKKELSWNKIKGSIVSAYAETFTADELKALVKFYSTPTGKKFIEKQPQLQQRMMMQQSLMMQQLMPKIKAIVAKYKK